MKAILVSGFGFRLSGGAVLVFVVLRCNILSKVYKMLDGTLCIECLSRFVFKDIWNNSNDKEINRHKEEAGWELVACLGVSTANAGIDKKFPLISRYPAACRRLSAT